MTPDAAWDALNAALLRYAPPCTGHAVFTADQRTALERAVCSSICARCPIADLCAAYATAAKPDSGFWAGTDRSSKHKRATKTTAPGGSRQTSNEGNAS
ncbi:WhiB family transcriptional regulator [Microbacterium sp. NPDC096154]|uniref:WhiB family transcriptional regulator n=1 Tax=Microbacterium sp. NPDC096154 TaxID=3155549 RepID=UPI003326BBD1